MLATLQLRAGAPRARPRRASCRRDGRSPHDSVLVPAGEFVLGVNAAEEPSSLDNERPRTRRRRPRVPHRPRPRDQRRVAGVRRGRRLRPAELWSDARLGAPARGRARAARSPGAPTAPARGSASSRTSRPTSRCSTSATSRPRPSPLGRAPGCPPRSSGRRPAPGTRQRGRRRRWPWGDGRPRRARQPRRRRAAPRAGGCATRPARRRTGSSSSSATSGSGRPRLRAVARVQPDALRAVQRAVLRRRLPRAARWLVGDGGVDGPAVVPQLGPPVPPADLHRRPPRLGRLMCRHLAWFGAPRSVASLVLDPDHGLLTQSWAPAPAGARHGQRRRLGHRAAPRGRGSGRPWRSDKPIWSDTNLASMAPHLVAGRVIAAVRSATEGMPADATAAAPFLHDGWLVSHNGRVDRARRRSQPRRRVRLRRGAARRAGRRRGSRARGRHPARHRRRRPRRTSQPAAAVTGPAARHALGRHAVRAA